MLIVIVGVWNILELCIDFIFSSQNCAWGAAHEVALRAAFSACLSSLLEGHEAFLRRPTRGERVWGRGIGISSIGYRVWYRVLDHISYSQQPLLFMVGVLELQCLRVYAISSPFVTAVSAKNGYRLQWAL